MKISYFKTQWFRLLVSAVCLVIACIQAFRPAPDLTTVAGLDTVIGYLTSAGLWFIASITWSLMSVINYQDLCIKDLNKRLVLLESVH